jgi:hypothetical protein
MKFRHQYQVVLQLDKLSINVPFKGRVGAQGKWDFSPNGKDRRIKQNRTFKIIPGTNQIRGLNGDFWFRDMNLWAREGILFGRDWTNGQPPIHVNPKMLIMAPKHMLAVCQTLMERGILK